jgi:bifunctional pyridoxal-dependent enzyme with beta-cystathionase and maltose regulon repressor activities
LPTVYARVIIDSINPQNPTGTAYYDSSLPTNEKMAQSFDVYVATNEIVYSAV